MPLDIRTLVVASLMVAGLMGAFSLLFATLQGGTRVIASWGSAMLVLAAGLLGIALRGSIPDLISMIGANTLIVAGMVLGMRGLRVFCGGGTRDPFGWGVTALLLAVLLLLFWVWPNESIRVVAVSIAIIVTSVRAALLLGRKAPPECRLSCLFTEIVFWSVALLTGLRLAVAMAGGGGTISEPTTLNAVTFVFYAAFILVATLGVMWMEIQQLHWQLFRLATRDSLTGVLNRGALLAEAEREIARSKRHGQKFGIAIFDIDRFKTVNDTHGHPVGDRVLVQMVGTIEGTLREYDVIGRYGGEEFVVLMPNSDRDTALAIAERARRAVEQREFGVAGTPLKVTVSAGVAEFDRDGADWDRLVKSADDALYAAKHGGRNKVVAAAA